MTAPRQVEEQLRGWGLFCVSLSILQMPWLWGGEQKRVIQTTPSDEIAGFWTPLETWSAFLAGFRGFDRKTAQRAP
jgi:hypothetical protein